MCVFAENRIVIRPVRLGLYRTPLSLSFPHGCRSKQALAARHLIHTRTDAESIPKSPPPQVSQFLSLFFSTKKKSFKQIEKFVSHYSNFWETDLMEKWFPYFCIEIEHEHSPSHSSNIVGFPPSGRECAAVLNQSSLLLLLLCSSSLQFYSDWSFGAVHWTVSYIFFFLYNYHTYIEFDIIHKHSNCLRFKIF